MKRRQGVSGLVALNAALLVGLAVVTLSPSVVAQPGGGDRARGTYTMVTGRVTGSTTGGVHIVDSTNQELVTLIWDRTRSRFTGVGYRNIAADARQGGAR